jgi:hypothetical protein
MVDAGNSAGDFRLFDFDLGRRAHSSHTPDDPNIMTVDTLYVVAAQINNGWVYRFYRLGLL